MMTSSSKQARKAEKKQRKRERRARNKPIRIAVCSVVLLVLLVLGFTFGPVVGDVAALFQIRLGSTGSRALVEVGTEFGDYMIDSSDPQVESARKHANAVARELSDEGIVLLKNEDNALPLQTKKLNVFGVLSCNIRYGGGGSVVEEEVSPADIYTDLYSGLHGAGIDYNDALATLYRTHKSNKGEDASPGLMQVIRTAMFGAQDEPEIGYLTQDILSEAKQFSSNALIVLSNQGVEAVDFDAEQLCISKNQTDLIRTVAQAFENVIIVVNSGNAMELGFLDQYPSIKAALWIGNPGPYGCDSLGEILAGNLNPSGRLPDTYAYNIQSSPASVNFGDFHYKNVRGM